VKEPNEVPVIETAQHEPAHDHTHHKKSENSKRHHRIGGFFSFVMVIVVAIGIAIFLTLFVFQSYQVDGPSMQNTLHTGDRLLVWKLPRTWARITGHQYVPKRGDIVVFTQSNLQQYGDTVDTKQLVKRVIGLPGDHIVIKNNTLTVYNKQNPNGFQPDKTIGYASTGGILDTPNNLDVTIGKNELFVCGDNRPDSLDSRIFGPIKTSQIIGKLAVRIMPLSKFKEF
jgi:signal peptidase I